MDFQLAELESVLDMFGLIDHCQIHPLPNDDEHELWSDGDGDDDDGATRNKKGVSFHVYYRSLEAKKQEAIRRLVRRDGDGVEPTNEDADEPTAPRGRRPSASSSSLPWKRHRPFLILSFPKDLGTDASSSADASSRTEREDRSLRAVLRALSRCVLVRSVLELWGRGTDLARCAADVRRATERDDAHPGAVVAAERGSWKLTVRAFGSRHTREEQNEMRAAYSFLPCLAGPARMDDPDEEYQLVREIEVDERGSPLRPRRGHDREILPENDARPPLGAYFGRVLSAGLREGRVDKYHLTRRPYLGPTSMDAELSMIMTNLGQVRKGHFCFDPFVGTGSILLTCALEGAYCFGTDIDVRVLRGRGADENVSANFRRFGLPRPEIVRSDNSVYHRHYRCSGRLPLFDAVVCDPPYGIRAGARRSGSRRPDVRPIPDDRRHDHVAQTRPYVVSDVMADLLDVSARTLTTRTGRLVYVVPSLLDDFDPSVDLPRHECLELVHVCYQPLQTTNLGRRVVVMRKVADYDEDRREDYRRRTWVNGPESAEKCANIREKLVEAAKAKPGYEERRSSRQRKRKARREELKSAKTTTTTTTKPRSGRREDDDGAPPKTATEEGTDRADDADDAKDVI